MTTKEALDQWAREAVALSVCECLHAVATEMDSHAKDLRGEVWWRLPSDADWSRWSKRRRLVEGPSRPDEA